MGFPIDSTIVCAVGAFLISFQVYVVRKLAVHDISLALLIQQVNPPGDKSLRSIVQEIQLEQVRQVKP